MAYSEDYVMEATFENLVGKVLQNINKTDTEILFTCADGKAYRMYHYQDCCEHVYVEDVQGDLEDLLNTPILYAYKETNSNNAMSKWDESSTWTFYRIGTVKGAVVIRWYGSSNGYYSESVEFDSVD